MDLQLISGAVGGLGALAGSFKFVKEGEIGCVITFGKASRKSNGEIKLINSGFKFLLPLVQSIQKVHLRKNTAHFDNLQVTLKNGISYKFNAYIVFHVIETPKAVENVLFGLEDYQEFVSLTFEKAIQNALSNCEELDSVKLEKTIIDSIKTPLENEGIEVDDCGLVSFSATDSSQSLLGIQYKLDLASTSNLDPGIIAAAIGATPTVVTNHSKVVEKHIEE